MESRRRTELAQQALDFIQRDGHERREVPFKLASGQMSQDYIDGKYAVGHGAQLAIVSRAILELAHNKGMEFTAVGGLTMGADALAHGIAVIAERSWFSVRKQPKPRGREQWIEGARLSASDSVLLVDDVVTSGGSIMLAYERVITTGAKVTGVIPMVDRGDAGAERFRQLRVPYAALVTYHDLEIEPVGQALAGAASG